MRDLDIRKSLHKRISSLFRDDPDLLIVDELALCQGDARVDVAVINGSLHGFEIKSSRDTLERLPAQQEIYGRVLDTMTLVLSEGHLEKAKTIIPKWWGIIRVKEKHRSLFLKQIRKPQVNNHIDCYHLAQLLWREEALIILQKHGLANRLKSKPRRFLWHALSESFTHSELNKLVRETLRNRLNWRVASTQM